MNRRERKIYAKEKQAWNNLEQGALTQLVEKFGRAVFESEEDYPSLFERFAQKYQARVEAFNRKQKLLQADELWFFRKYFPVETLKKAA